MQIGALMTSRNPWHFMFMSNGCTARGTATRNDGYSKLPFSSLDPKIRPRLGHEFNDAREGDEQAYKYLVDALEDELVRRKDVYPMPATASYRGLAEVVWLELIHCEELSVRRAAELTSMSKSWYCKHVKAYTEKVFIDIVRAWI